MYRIHVCVRLSRVSVPRVRTNNRTNIHTETLVEVGVGAEAWQRSMHVCGNGALAGNRCALQLAVSTTARGRKGVPNGESAAARLNHPWDVKVDKLATIVVANRLNHRLRKIVGRQVTRWRVRAVVICRAFFYFFASKSHHKYKKIFFFFRRSKRQRNFSSFFLLHKIAKPILPPCLPSYPPARTQNLILPPCKDKIYPKPLSTFSTPPIHPFLRPPIHPFRNQPFCLSG